MIESISRRCTQGRDYIYFLDRTHHAVLDAGCGPINLSFFFSSTRSYRRAFFLQIYRVKSPNIWYIRLKINWKLNINFEWKNLQKSERETVCAVSWQVKRNDFLNFFSNLPQNRHFLKCVPNVGYLKQDPLAPSKNPCSRLLHHSQWLASCLCLIFDILMALIESCSWRGVLPHIRLGFRKSMVTRKEKLSKIEKRIYGLVTIGEQSFSINNIFDTLEGWKKLILAPRSSVNLWKF